MERAFMCKCGTWGHDLGVALAVLNDPEVLLQTK